MNFDKKICVLQVLLGILIFPGLNLMFSPNRGLLGAIWLLSVLLISSCVAYTAKYVIDPAHVSRLKRGE